MKERFAGFLLMCAVVPLAVVGYFILWWVGIFGPNARGRAGVRALDHFVNATVFNGYAWESISSHAWRVREEKRWARFVIWVTNHFQQDHCQRANKREQPLVNFIMRRGLEKQTIARPRHHQTQSRTVRRPAAHPTPAAPATTQEPATE